MPSFIYVFGEKDRDRLIELKYEMLKGDERKHTYVFLNRNYRQDFSDMDFKFVLSDTLTF